MWPERTVGCGAVGRAEAEAGAAGAEVGERVSLCGWVNAARNLGGLVFFDLRDASGVVQVASDPQAFPAAHAAAERVRAEYCLHVEGTVRQCVPPPRPFPLRRSSRSGRPSTGTDDARRSAAGAGGGTPTRGCRRGRWRWWRSAWRS